MGKSIGKASHLMDFEHQIWQVDIRQPLGESLPQKKQPRCVSDGIKRRYNRARYALDRLHP